MSDRPKREFELMIKAEKPLERCKLHKSDAVSDPNYGCAPRDRSIQEYIERGVVIIDKPAGPTSHDVVAWVKAILNLKNAAHTGTLDPNVTGVLPVLLSVTRKLADAFVWDKEYVFVMKLHGAVDEAELRKVSAEFVGRIYQKPPLKSAVKRRIRVRTVRYIEIKEMEGTDVLMRVGCEAGTYIRMLCHHIGLALGVGAHMLQLRRTKSFPFDETKITTLQDLKDAYFLYEEGGDESHLRELIIPLEDTLGHLPCIIVKDTAVDAICHGAALALPGISRIEEGINMGNRVVLYTLKGEAIGIGKAKMGSKAMFNAEAGICVETEKVFMKPGTYMKGWGDKETE